MSGRHYESVTITEVASFVDRLGATFELDGHGSLRVDIAFGGASFVLVDAAHPPTSSSPSSLGAAVPARLGAWLAAAANEQLGFPSLDWNRISLCQIAGLQATIAGVAKDAAHDRHRSRLARPHGG